MSRKPPSRVPTVARHGFKIIPDQEDLGRTFGQGTKIAAGAFATVVEEILTGASLDEAAKEKQTAGRKKRYRRAAADNCPPQRELDLHGKTAREAKVAVKNFVATARRLGLKSVRIITGKGLHSDGAPILPGIVEEELAEMKLEQTIRDFAWEKRHHEKSGSLIVSLP